MRKSSLDLGFGGGSSLHAGCVMYKCSVSCVSGNERQVYEFVTRHFLACCSRDAEGLETIVDIDIAGEKVKFCNNLSNLLKE
jgi:DNA topoisomerase IA